jgi:hypothetical protein
MSRSRTRFASGRFARRYAAFGTWAVAIALVLAVVAPASAAAGPTRLSDGSASPTSGTTLTTIRFSVTYRNREGSPADWVRVRVAGSTHTMSTSGTDWKGGVLFRWSGKLPAGKHAVTFEAMSRDRFADSLGGGSVTIKVPATASPTPKPTPKPTPRPTATPSPAATPKPTPRPSATPTPSPSPPSTASASPTDGTTPGATTAPSGPPTGQGSGPTASPSDIAIAFVPGPGADGGGSDATGGDPNSLGGNGPAGDPGTADPGPLSAITSAMSALDGARPVVPLGLVATLITTTGVVSVAMGFGLFGKRRRDGEPPDSDDVLAAAAASGVAVANAYGFADRPTADAAAAALLLDPEMAMPRWRRPSLLEARRADPLRDTAAAPRLTFDHGLVGALDGRERRLIGYNVVRLLDTPDELRGAEIGFLDQGDEVQLLEKRGVYWLVLCPDGRQGWVHKMTLGETVGEPPVTSSPTATMPIAPETWTMGDDVDGDVLTAYLESRRRA